MRWSTNEISSGALQTVSEDMNASGEGIPVLIYNPLGWARSGDVEVKVQLPENSREGVVIRDASSTAAPSLPLESKIDAKTGVAVLTVHVSNVPALGYKTIRILSSKLGAAMGASAHDDADSITIERDGLRVRVDKKTGCITSLEKAVTSGHGGFEALAAKGCGNELQAFNDKPKDYDAWNIDPGTLDVAPTLLNKVDSIGLVGEKTPNPAIHIVRTWQSSKFVQTITIRRVPDWSTSITTSTGTRRMSC